MNAAARYSLYALLALGAIGWAAFSDHAPDPVVAQRSSAAGTPGSPTSAAPGNAEDLPRVAARRSAPAVGSDDGSRQRGISDPYRAAAAFAAPSTASAPSATAKWSPGREFLHARDLRAFFDRYGQDPAPSAELKAALAQALEECRRVARQGSAVVRERMRLVMTGPDPSNILRQEAMDRALARCARFEGMSIDDATIRRLWQEAEAEGDPRARSRSFASAFMAKPDDATLVETAKSLLASKDPRVIDELGGLIASRSSRVTLGDGERPNPRAWAAAWEMAGCSFGGDCGPGSRLTLSACWRDGACGAQSIEEALARTTLSAEQYQMALAYRDRIVAAIDSGDWGAIGLGESPEHANWRWSRYGVTSSEVSEAVGARVRVVQREGRYQVVIDAGSPESLDAVLTRLR